MDGYFPSELQPFYPDGVPLQASATPSFWAQITLLLPGTAQVFFQRCSGWSQQQGEAEVCGAVQVCLGRREARRAPAAAVTGTVSASRVKGFCASVNLPWIKASESTEEKQHMQEVKSCVTERRGKIFSKSSPGKAFNVRLNKYLLKRM